MPYNQRVMGVYGDVLSRNSINSRNNRGIVNSSTGSIYTFNQLEKIIERPFIKPRYKLCVLNPDETIAYEIPETDIPSDGISFTEEYQNGQRKNMSVQLINVSGKYTPNLSGLWINSRFSFDVGLELPNGEEIWFPKGVFIMGNITLTNENSNKIVSIQLLDKFAVFEGKTGTLEVAYEVETGSHIVDAIKGILNFSIGNGYVMDYKEPIFDPSFVSSLTQTNIRCEAGDSLGNVINELAIQISAEYYYNNVGNLCFYPINETINDDAKPIIWTFTKINRELHNLELNYQNENIVNCIKVIGDNIDNGIYSAVVKNENPASPICVQQVGARWEKPYTSANIWNNDLAKDLAAYYLRKASFVSVDFSCNISFNPILTVNNICEVENAELKMKREKLLLTSISYSSGNGLMSVKFCNTNDLPT